MRYPSDWPANWHLSGISGRGVLGPQYSVLDGPGHHGKEVARIIREPADGRRPAGWTWTSDRITGGPTHVRTRAPRLISALADLAEAYYADMRRAAYRTASAAGGRQ